MSCNCGLKSKSDRPTDLNSIPAYIGIGDKMEKIKREKGYKLLSISEPTKESEPECFLILEHEDGHCISGWIKTRRI